jgi:Heparinase II/III-like protein
MIVDAGTYTYRSRRERWPEGEPAWRSHFLGPAAHNTLSIGGQDPLGRGPGDFPSGRLKSRVLAEPLASAAALTVSEAKVVGDTAYEGYVRGVVHVHGAYWLIYDLLPPSALAQDAWLSLHFSPRATVVDGATCAFVSTIDDAQLLVALSRGHRAIELAKGWRDPLVGWASPRYGDLVPAATLRVATRDGPNCAATLLQPTSRLTEFPTLDVQHAHDGSVGVRIEAGDRCDYIILSRRAGSQSVNCFGVELHGDALWLRTQSARPIELRALAGRKARSESLGFSVTSRRGARDLQVMFERETEVRRVREEIGVEVVIR